MISQIETAHAMDAPLLARLHALGFETFWAVDEFEALLKAPGVFGFVAHAPDQCGFLLARVAADEAEILTLVVAPEARRRGVARALLAHAMAAAHAFGARTLLLEVAESNSAARGLYDSCGFAEVARRPAYYEEARGAGDALVMSRPLADPSF